MSSRPADSALIDVACPACGEVYHLRPDSIGKRMECVNKLCRQRFVVEAPASSPAVDKPVGVEPQMPEVLAAHPADIARSGDVRTANANVVADDDAPPIQIPQARSSPAGSSPTQRWTSSPPSSRPSSPLAAAQPSPSQPAAVIPSAAPAQDRTKRRRGQPRWAVTLEIVSAVVLVVLASYVGVLQFQEWSKTPAEEWKKAQALYQDHKWEHAQAAFNKYAERFPQAPETATVPFFLELCAAGDEVYSPTGDLGQGMAALERLFRSHRDSPAYHDYAGDLFQALGRLVERSIDRAKQLSELDDFKQAKKAADDVARARQAHELLGTVAESMKDAWVPERVEKLQQTIDTTARDVKLNLTRTEIVANFRRVPGFPLEDDLAGVYARIDELLHDEPELTTDTRVLKEQALAHRSEAARVRYQPQTEDDDEPPAESTDPPAGKTLAVVWKPAEDAQAAATIDGDASSVVVALAQGVLYAFDTTGKPLWARRLGLDVDRLPARATVGADGGEVLIVRSAAEQALLALETASGDERWRFAASGAMTAPVTLVTMASASGDAPLLRGLVPTADGRIYVLEPVLGKQLGYYETGWPLTVGGAYDPVTRRIYFAADFDRVLAIDPAATADPKRPACSAVLFTRHASGSLRSEPLIVGPYLVLIEGSELDRSRLRAWSVSEGGFADPDVMPLAEQAVDGWSWFATQSSPDRLLFATDRGELGLFGLNLDNPSEAIYPLIEDPSQPPSTVLSGISGTRALLAYAQNQSLWVQAGSSLRRLTMDVVDRQVNQAWSTNEDASADSIPLHEAQAREVRRKPFVYVATMTADANRFEFAAREAESGATLWRRQLGLRPLGDPLVDQGRILMADRSGRIAALTIDNEPANATMLLEPDDRVPLADIVGEPSLIDDTEGRPWLFARLAGTGGVAVRPLAPNSVWQRLRPPTDVVGSPCMLKSSLVAACSDGLVHRLTPGASADINEQPFAWFVGERVPHAEISITPVGHETVLLCDAQTVRRLQYQVRDSVGQWVELGKSYSADGKLFGRPLIHGEHIFITKASGMVEVLDAYNPARMVHRWPLPGTPTSDLFVRAGHVLLIVEDHLLVSLTSATDAFASDPMWTSEAPAGTICGQPQVYGSSLIVADTSGAIRAVDLEGGEKIWETQLRPGQAPAAAPTVLADRYLMVPLIDGTLTLALLPAPTAEQTEQAK